MASETLWLGPCPDCGGSGLDPLTTGVDCPRCDGEGTLP